MKKFMCYCNAIMYRFPVTRLLHLIPYISNAQSQCARFNPEPGENIVVGEGYMVRCICCETNQVVVFFNSKHE